MWIFAHMLMLVNRKHTQPQDRFQDYEAHLHNACENQLISWYKK